MFKKSILGFTKLFSIGMIAVMLLLAFTPAVQASSEPASTCGSSYVVQPGDWMAKIARYCGVSYSALLAANPQVATPWLIYPGQVLNVPGSGQVYPAVTISPTSGVPGTTITITGTGFPANTAVYYGAARNQGYNPNVPAVTSNGSGAFTAQVAIPTSANAGEKWNAYAYVPDQIAAVYSNVFLVTSSGNSQGNYIVQRGDTLRIIANRFGTTVNAILAVNPQIVNPNLIYPGQVLVVPGSTGGIPDPPPAGGKIYYVQSGDTLKKIAARFGTTLDALLAANPQITNQNLIYVGQAIKLPAGVQIYVVQRGDTLRKISDWFGVSIQTLLSLNPQITNQNVIYVGQVVRVQ